MKIKTDGTEYTTLELIRKILIRELDLDQERVNLANQKFKIPADEGLFIVIESMGMPKILSNRNKPIPSADSFIEVQEVATQEMVAVSLFSRNLDAYKRITEVLMAISSLYSQALQEEHSFKIARISPIQNISAVEGGAILYRYETTLVVFGWYEKTKTGDYYDTFTADVSTEKETVTVPLT